VPKKVRWACRSSRIGAGDYEVLHTHCELADAQSHEYAIVATDVVVSKEHLVSLAESQVADPETTAAGHAGTSVDPAVQFKKPNKQLQS
jgi:hypothetical protein